MIRQHVQSPPPNPPPPLATPFRYRKKQPGLTEESVLLMYRPMPWHTETPTPKKHQHESIYSSIMIVECNNEQKEKKKKNPVRPLNNSPPGASRFPRCWAKIASFFLPSDIHFFAKSKCRVGGTSNLQSFNWHYFVPPLPVVVYHNFSVSV